MFDDWTRLGSKKTQRNFSVFQVVNTSQLIKDDQDLFSSQKVACFIEEEHLTSLIASAPSKNVLTRVFNEKTWLPPGMTKERHILKSDRCLMKRNPSIYSLFNSNFYLIGERSSANYVLAISFMFERLFKKLWINERAISEYPLMMYHARDKPKINGE